MDPVTLVIQQPDTVTLTVTEQPMNLLVTPFVPLAAVSTTATSASYASTASFAVSASYALNGGAFVPLSGSSSVTGSLSLSGSLSANAVRVMQNGSPIISLGASGSVGTIGFGTTNPEATIDVRGSNVLRMGPGRSYTMTIDDPSGRINFGLEGRTVQYGIGLGVSAQDGTQLAQMSSPTSTGLYFSSGDRIHFTCREGGGGGSVIFGKRPSDDFVIVGHTYEFWAGDVEIRTASKGLILTSANGTKYKLTVANDGTLSTTAV